MTYWNEYPFVRPLIVFTTGILLELVAGIHFPLWVLAISLLVTAALHFSMNAKKIKAHRYASYAGLSLQLSLLVAGNAAVFRAIDSNHSNHFTRRDTTATCAIVRITEPVIEKERSIKVMAEVLQTINGAASQNTSGKVILYFKKDSESEKLEYGNVVLVKNNFKEIAPPKNPGEFNYKRYLCYHEIYRTAFISSEDWTLLPSKRVNPLFQFTFWLRDVSVLAFKSFVTSEREASVDEALVIGFRDDMSYETLQSYTAAGVVHVLAVSGLHVGILFAFLHQLLFFLNRKKNGKIMQAFIILCIIWLFAMLTGLSGSVVRAATMFSFITIGKNMKRSISMNNMLAGSALLILLINPLLVTDVGLQLSYVAVFGITSLTSYINNWLDRENRIVDGIWKMVAMSLAAQIATLPLTVFYFNQFPTYFLIANLLVIPAAGILLYLGIALIVFQFLPPVAMVIGKVTEVLTWLLNEYILRIQQLPLSILYLPAMSLLQALSMALLVVFISYYFITREKRWLMISLGSLFLIIALHAVMRTQQQQASSITLYSLKNKTALEFRRGNEVILFRSTDTLASQENLYFQRHFQLENITHRKDLLLVHDTAKFLDEHLHQTPWGFCFENYRLAIVQYDLEPVHSDKRIPVDALIITSNPKTNIKTILEVYDTQLIIFDGTNSPYLVKQWKQEAAGLSIPTFDVNSSGAFIKAF